MEHPPLPPAAAPASGLAPAAPGRVAPWLALYTAGRIAIAAVLVALVWVAGLPGFPALLFGILLHMPAAYLLLRPVRDRLTAALAARQNARAAARAELRARLRGAEPE